MTGWRLGWAAGRAELIGALTKVKSYVDTGPFLALQKAGVVALDRTEEFAAPVRADAAGTAGCLRRGSPRGRLRGRVTAGGDVSLGAAARRSRVAPVLPARAEEDGCRRAAAARHSVRRAKAISASR